MFISSTVSMPRHFLIVSSLWEISWSSGIFSIYSLILSSIRKSASTIRILQISATLSSEIFSYSSSSSSGSSSSFSGLPSSLFFLCFYLTLSSSSSSTGTHSLPNCYSCILTSHFIILSFSFLTSSSFIFIISLYLSESAFSKCLNFLYNSLNYFVILLYSCVNFLFFVL